MTDIHNNYQTQILQGNVNRTLTATWHIHYHPPHTLPQLPHTLPPLPHTLPQLPHTLPQLPHTHTLPDTTHTTRKYKAHTTHTQPALYILLWNGSATHDLPSRFIMFAVILDLRLEVVEPLGLDKVYLLVFGGGALSGVLDRETVAIVIIIRIVQWKFQVLEFHVLFVGGRRNVPPSFGPL